MTLGEEDNLTNEQKMVVAAPRKAVEEWHELDHRQEDVLDLKMPPGVLAD